MRFELSRYFQTTKRLKVMLDRIDSCDQEELFHQYLRDVLEIDPSKDYQQVPYWVEVAALSCKNEDAMPEEYRCEYREGYHEPLNIGHKRNIEGRTYRYIDSVPLSAEQELQAEDGGLCYLYHGENYLRIWEPVAKKEE